MSKHGTSLKLHLIQQEDGLDFPFVGVFNDCPGTDVVTAVKFSYLFPKSGKCGIRNRISGRVADAEYSIVVLQQVNMLVSGNGFENIIQSSIVAGIARK